jgi:elongation factor 1-alpha
MSDSKEGKQHVSIVICGHVDAGKSTTTGRLIFELGGISEREMEKLKAEADTMGKGSFAFAFYMDKTKEERARGVTIACTTKEFYTKSYHYTIIDAPGHRDFIKNMITGASQADVALLMVPADGNFAAAIAKQNHKQGIVQGQTRQHARLINLLGVKQLVVGVNKMDCDVAKYSQERYDEIASEMRLLLGKVGWGKKKNEVPVIPISGWIGDNLLTKSDKMKWWKGHSMKIKVKGEKKKILIETLLDVLENMVQPPERKSDKKLRCPVSGVYKIKGVGDVITGRVEEGIISPGDSVLFLPTHTASKACSGKIFSVEMHHKSVPKAESGDNVGLSVKGLDKVNMPRVGDVIIKAGDDSLKRCKNFTAQVQVLDHPGKLKVGYTPVGFVRTGRSAVRMSKIVWKMGKKTGKQKVDDPSHIEANEVGECVFEPQQPFVCDKFKNSEGLGRIAIMEGNGVVMLGKISGVEFAEDAKK